MATINDFIRWNACDAETGFSLWRRQHQPGANRYHRQ